VWGVSISSLGTNLTGMGMGGQLLCHGRMQCRFSSPGAVKPFHGVPGWIQARFVLHPMLTLQCVARAYPAAGAMRLPLCLKRKSEIKHINVSSGTLDVDLWCSCALVRAILLWGLSWEDLVAQTSAGGEVLVLIFGVLSCLKSRSEVQAGKKILDFDNKAHKWGGRGKRKSPPAL